MDIELALPFIYAGFGALSNVLVPWFIKLINDPEAAKGKASWDYVWPKLLTFVVIALVAPLIGDVDSLNELGFVPAYLAGWAIADIGKTFIMGAVSIKNR